MILSDRREAVRVSVKIGDLATHKRTASAWACLNCGVAGKLSIAQTNAANPNAREQGTGSGLGIAAVGNAQAVA